MSGLSEAVYGYLDQISFRVTGKKHLTCKNSKNFVKLLKELKLLIHAGRWDEGLDS